MTDHPDVPSIVTDPLGDEYMQDWPGSIKVTGATLGEIVAAARERGISDTARIVYGYCGHHEVYLDPTPGGDDD